MNANMAYGFTETELDIARHTDLPDLLSSLGYTLKRIGSYYTTAEMAGAIIALIPTILIFALFLRNIVSGMTSGAVKE